MKISSYRDYAISIYWLENMEVAMSEEPETEDTPTILIEKIAAISKICTELSRRWPLGSNTVKNIITEDTYNISKDANITVSRLYNEYLLTEKYGSSNFGTIRNRGHTDYVNIWKLPQYRKYTTKYQEADQLEAIPLTRTRI